VETGAEGLNDDLAPSKKGRKGGGKREGESKKVADLPRIDNAGRTIMGRSERVKSS